MKRAFGWVVAICVAFGFGAVAQDQGAPLGGLGGAYDQGTQNAPDGEQDSAKGEAFFPDLPENFVPDDVTLDNIQLAVREYYAYRSRSFQHRTRLFEWQYASSRIIFVLVVAIVLLGLYFSWVQFHKDDKLAERGVSTIEATKTGFKISSPVLGVIILALSLGFLYLYLLYVYPIFDTF